MDETIQLLSLMLHIKSKSDIQNNSFIELNTLCSYLLRKCAKKGLC